MESSMVLGALLLAAIQFLLTDANRAFATLTIFLAAGTRIAPAVMRIQQGLIQLRSSIGTSRPTLELSQKLNSVSGADSVSDEIFTEHGDFRAELVLKQVHYSYPHSAEPALKNVNLKISDGSSVAIVGPSGAGKTTLVDVFLGVLEIETGEVKISDLRPVDAIKKWPGAIAYVPQDTVLVNATIRENIAIGFPADAASDQICWEALELAQLSEYVRALPKGLDYMVHESGSNLSGGQRQRLGIARALLTKPRILVLDEATSSLDARTELEISSAIQSLKGLVTVITIAHRLSTVQHADRVVYLDRGEVKAEGSFEEVRLRVPNFDEQAKLMGL
jgi:ABC-type multidrug transport system fused ATPase/permease subunit